MSDSQPSASPHAPDPSWGDATRAVHAGASAGGGTSVSPPIFQTSTFRFESVEQGAELSASKAPSQLYTRWGNPTTRQLERACAELEGGEAALCFASGMAAGSSAVLSLLQAGDHVVAADCLYAGMTELFERVLGRFGVATTFVEPSDAHAFERALRPETKLIFVETPANPTLAITDLVEVARIGKAHGAFTLADNTWASPVNTRPLELGIDGVFHSSTKYLNGHTDVIAGCVVGRAAWIERVWSVLKVFGGCPSPHDSWLVLRGLRTLPLRVARQNESALALARALAEHPAVSDVHYPGLEQHPGHAVARRQMRGFGGMLAFEVRGGLAAGRTVLEALRVATHAVSLGGVETLAVHPASTTHSPLTPEERARGGIGEGLIRVSVGLEDVADLIVDFRRALDAAE